MRNALAAGGLAALLAATVAAPRVARAESSAETVARCADAYLDRMVERRPDLASRLGDHAAEGRLRAVTEATLDQDADWLHGLAERLEAVPRDGLDPDEAADHDVLDARIAADLLALGTERTFRTDPNAYLALVAAPIADPLRRDRLPMCHRLRTIARRLARVPEVLRAARINLDRPARLRTEVAIERFEAVLRFYREAVPKASLECRDARTQADVAEADSAAVRATRVFLAFLRDDLLPRSDGRLALGGPLLAARLAAREMEDTPLDTLRARGLGELDATRARMDAVAGRIAPDGGLRVALGMLEHDIPRADSLVPAVRQVFEAAGRFAGRQRMVDVPGGVRVEERPAPLGSRFRAPVAIDAPGPWESTPYRIHLDVREGAAAGGLDDHRGGPGVEGAGAASVHEGWTGHLAQSVAWRRTPSRLRQALAARSTVEGWACYGEGLMLEQGFRSGDDAFELAVLQRAAVVLARLVAGISIHTGTMTPDEAAAFIGERCGLAPDAAAREARALAVDPDGIADQIGVWRLRALRDEVRAALGDRFDLRAFHEAVLRQGPSPLPVVRRLVLSDFGIPLEGGD